MANRFPLIVDSSSQQIKELPDGDSLLLGDSEKLILGDGSDLQLFHDGSDSYLKDAGTGRLVIETDGTDVSLKAGSENMLVATKDGAVTLYYDNSPKVATTTSGMALTGDLAGNGAPFTISNTSNGNNIDIKTTSSGSLVHALKIHSGGRVEAKLSANIAQVALTSSSNAVAWDSAVAANAYYATTENTTFAAPSNAFEGAIISVEIAQGSSAYTVAWNTVFEFAASTAPTVTATANKTDIFSFRYNGSVWQEIGRVQNMAQT